MSKRQLLEALEAAGAHESLQAAPESLQAAPESLQHESMHAAPHKMVQDRFR